jgi:hypothetical protein
MSLKIACALGALISLCACSNTSVHTAPGDAASRQAKAEASLCKKMARESPAVRGYPEVGDKTALNDVKSANLKTERAVDDVAQAQSQINNAQILIIQAAYQQLRQVTDSIPGGRATVGPAAEQIRLHSGHLRAAWDSLYSSLQCGA